MIPWFSRTEGNTYANLLHHPFLFGENQRSAQEVARRISGAVAGESTQKSIYQVPITILISRITLFSICLSFSSPPLHPCRFIRHLSLSSLSICLFLLACFLFACLLDCLLVTMAQDNTKLCDFTNTNNNAFTHRRISMLLREATSEIYGPRVYLHPINLPSF